MKHYKRFLLLFAMLSIATFGMAQTSFDSGEGCLNVIDVSYARGIGKYGDGGISANYLHEKFNMATVVFLQTTCTKSSITSDSV